jgi:acyl carrier protein
MEKTEIYKNLTEIFRDVFDDESIILRPDLTADDVDDWDSISHIRMVLMVQKAFHVKFSASEIGKLKNVGELADLVNAKAG